MNGANMTDVGLLLPELILVGMALVLILAARRIQKAPLAAAPTVIAALAAALASAWLLSERPITWSGLSVAANARLTLTYDATVDAPGGTIDEYTPRVTASDSTPSNDDDEQNEDDETAALSLAKIVSDSMPKVGDVVTFTITLTNSGSDPATGVQIQDVIADGFSYITNISDDGTESKPGFGGMITVDGYSQFFKVLVAVALALAALLSMRRVEAEHIRPAEFHAVLLLAATGMMFAASALDLLTLYLSLELTTLCSYILVGITVERPKSNEAAIKYFLLGSFASALLLYGIALTYGVTGDTSFAAIRSALVESDLGSNKILLAAIGLLTAGLAFKIAAFPFHVWAPDAYQGASAPVAAFLAAASKAAGLAALGRVCLVAFESEARVLSMVLTGLAALSIIVGSITAVAQTDMKRLLAYSSIAHVGYALLGFISATSESGTAEGASATMTYTFFYVFMTLGAFGVVVALGERGERLDGYQGLAEQRPGTAALMLLFLLSLTGIPPTAGFVAKFVVIQSVVSTGHWSLAILAVVCSVISAFVYLRVAVLMYMKEPQEPAPVSCPPAVSAALAVAALVTLIGGIFPGSLTFWAVGP